MNIMIISICHSYDRYESKCHVVTSTSASYENTTDKNIEAAPSPAPCTCISPADIKYTSRIVGNGPIYHPIQSKPIISFHLLLTSQRFTNLHLQMSLGQNTLMLFRIPLPPTPRNTLHHRIRIRIMKKRNRHPPLP